jgi:hypothetical protein
MNDIESPLAILRKAAGMSQEALGKAIAEPDSPTVNHQPRISAYEQGKKRVPLPVAKKMVGVLNRHLKRQRSRRKATLDDMIHPNHR